MADKDVSLIFGLVILFLLIFYFSFLFYALRDQVATDVIDSTMGEVNDNKFTK